MYPAVVAGAEALAEGLAEAVAGATGAAEALTIGAAPRVTSPGISLFPTPKVIAALPREVRRKL